ncbi:Peptidase-M43 domain-containing protein [Sulfidibacter corallicola]|uniref:Peptidase M43 pregnancy-associated plasma-A domain-containing protein n=1 Tax=Sulfidibacter corallicola TaxID=2818388 RepID=A0A8A4TQK6_SULCO|nr:M43 family zinc metalloprotease [Sulfidibacter corallicola]QTD48825.1 hypothetical protein J3U87_24855 [Sulfidibacter corallicola]
MCGTPTPDDVGMREWAFRELVAQNTNLKTLHHYKLVWSVPIIWQVISDHQLTMIEQGRLRRQFNDQISIMNDAFVDTPFSFYTSDIVYTVNVDWFTGMVHDDTAEEAKGALHRGDNWALNIYLAEVSDLFYGRATFPMDLARDGVDQDGITLDYGSLPGGGNPNGGEGDVLVHEVGHWLGLYHTFQGGCLDDDIFPEVGDGVDDTPAHDLWVSGRECAPSQSCAGLLDAPIHNHMNYTPDSCRDEFTEGQIERMIQQTQLYRCINCM